MIEEEVMDQAGDVSGEGGDYAAPAVKVGINAHLRGVAFMLREISQKEKDGEKKAEYFGVVAQRLQQDAQDIGEMMEDLEADELPGALTELCQDIDGLFTGASNLHLDAINCMLEFMETEDPQAIDDSLQMLKEGSALLEQADGLVMQLSSIVKEASGTSIEI
jgi:hypothetical protein